MLVAIGDSFQKLPGDGNCGQYGWNCGSTVSNMDGLVWWEKVEKGAQLGQLGGENSRRGVL